MNKHQEKLAGIIISFNDLALKLRDLSKEAAEYAAKLQKAMPAFDAQADEPMTEEQAMSRIDFEGINEAFRRYDEALDEQDIKACPNANPDKGICPAARDTFYKLLARHSADYFNIPEKQKSTFIRDYMAGKRGHNEKEN